MTQGDNVQSRVDYYLKHFHGPMGDHVSIDDEYWNGNRPFKTEPLYTEDSVKERIQSLETALQSEREARGKVEAGRDAYLKQWKKADAQLAAAEERALAEYGMRKIAEDDADSLAAEYAGSFSGPNEIYKLCPAMRHHRNMVATRPPPPSAPVEGEGGKDGET